MPSADGALQMRELGIRLKALAGYQNGAASADLLDLGKGKTLRSQLLAGIRAASKPMIEDSRQAARDMLPRAGGLNEYVASTQISTYNRLTGPRVGVRIGTPTGTTQAKRAYGANKGTVYHPTIGTVNKPRPLWRWTKETVPKGWFDDSLRKSSSLVSPAIEAVCRRVAEEITRRI